MNKVAYSQQSSDVVVANDNDIHSLPAILDRARANLDAARNSAELLAVNEKINLAYDAGKRAIRLAKAKGAHDDLIARGHRMQADALQLMAEAAVRLADEYDAAQARGEVKKTGNPNSSKTEELPGATDIGLTHKQVHEARQIRDAELDNPGVVRNTLDALLEAGEEPTKAALNREITNHRAMGTGANEWYTPEEHIELARSVMGGFDLDPASNPIAQKRVQAAVYYTEETNGLDKEWNGRVWLNPPYAQPAISHFADKVLEETSSGRCTEAIVLTHNYTDTAWFQKMARQADAICFTRGRIKFEDPDGKRAAPTQGQAFFYFGRNASSFRDVFRDTGFVVEVK